MATLIRPKQWGYQKPSEGAQIDWGHPLACGLVVCVPMTDRSLRCVDIANNILLTNGAQVGNNHKWGATTRFGGGVEFTGTGFDYYPRWADMALAGWPTDSCTIAVAKKKTDTTLRNSSAFGTNNNTTGIMQALVPYTDGTVYWDYGGQSGANRLTAASLTMGDDLWMFTAGRRGSAIYQNGISRASQSTAITRINTASEIFYINFSTAGANGDLAIFSLLYVWKRELLPDEAAWLAAEPYAFLTPQTPARRFFIGAAVDATVTPAVIAITSAVPRANINTAAAPVVLPATTAVPQPAVNSMAGPAVVPVTVALPQATPVTDTSATVTPAVIPVTVAVPQTTLNTVAGPASIDLTVSIPQPGLPATIAPSVVPVTVNLPQATPDAHTAVTPSTVTVTVAFPAAGLNTSVSPAAIPVTVALPLAIADVAAVNATSVAVIAAAVASVATVTATYTSSSTVSDG